MEFHESFAIVFRNIARSTDARTVIASVIPPHRFYANSLRCIILTKNDTAVFGDEYNRKTAYILGVMNSLTFDFAARSKIQINLAPIAKSLPIPDQSDFDDAIATASARIACGTPGKSGKKDMNALAAFASTFSLRPKQLSPAERIDTAARLDAMVAHAYKLSKNEYQMVLDSFKFGNDPSLYDVGEADWSNHTTLRNFYGEVCKAAMLHFVEIATNRVVQQQ